MLAERGAGSSDVMNGEKLSHEAGKFTSSHSHSPEGSCPPTASLSVHEPQLPSSPSPSYRVGFGKDIFRVKFLMTVELP